MATEVWSKDHIKNCPHPGLEGVDPESRPQWGEGVDFSPHERVVERYGRFAVLQQEHWTLENTHTHKHEPLCSQFRSDKMKHDTFILKLINSLLCLDVL